MKRSPIEQGASSSFLKLSWAENHLNALKEEVRQFEETQPGNAVAEFKPKRPGYDLVFRVLHATPYKIALMAGDVIGCMRDALDHLIYELSVTYSGVPPLSHHTAWPVCEYRSQWPMRPKGRISKNSGEWKVALIAPKAQALVRRYQPFYGKHGNGPYRRDVIWALDELRNLDRHRRLSVVPATATGFSVELTVRRSGIGIIRQERRKYAGKDGAVIERVWLTPGALETDVSVKCRPVCKLVLDEPIATFDRTGVALVETLEWFLVRIRFVLREFLEFEPQSVQDFVKAPPFIEL